MLTWNWQALLAAVGLVSIILNCFIFVVLKFNDLHHLHLAVENIKSHLDKQDKKMHSFELSLTDLTARFQERTKVLKKKTR